MKSIRLSALALVLANLIPVVGVLAFGWRVFDVLILYWAENVIVGVINVMRMIKCHAAGPGPDFGLGVVRKMSAMTIPFFVVHYGFFCYGHYSAVIMLFGNQPWLSALWLGVAAIAVSHLTSFVWNFIGKEEYRRTTVSALMARPYGRIMVLHFTVIAGAFLMQKFGDALWMLIVLVGIKIAIDLNLHYRERVAFGSVLAAT